MKADYHFDVAKLLGHLEGNRLIQANAIVEKLDAQWYQEIIKDSNDKGTKPEEHQMWRPWRRTQVIKPFIMAGLSAKAVEEAKELYKEIVS